MLALFAHVLLHSAMVSIPTATYSLPELAERLSTPELAISVTGTLRERGALVGLHDRSPAKAMEIVCKALDLQAVSLGPGRIELDPDPEIEGRSKKWRLALLQDLTRRWNQRQVHFATMAKMDRTQLEDLERRFPGKSGDEDEWRAIQMLLQAAPVTKASFVLAAAAAGDLNSGFLTEPWQRSESAVALSPEVDAQLQQRMAFYGGLRNPTMLQRIFSRWPGRLTIQAGVFATESKGLWVALPTLGALTQFGCNPASSTKRVLFSEMVNPPEASGAKGLGPDATTWFDTSKVETERELSRPGLDKPIEQPSFRNSLSARVQEWAETNQQEVVMELAPMAESVTFSPGTTAPLTPVKLSVASILAQDDEWGLTALDGVLVVRNRTAFLDRFLDCPVGSIAHFARVAAGRCGTFGSGSPDDVDAGPGLPFVQDLLPLVRLRFSRPNHEWFDYSGYHGLTDTYLRGRSLLLWPGLPQRVMTEIGTTAQGKRGIGVSSWRPDQIQVLGESLMNREDPPQRLQEVTEMLQRARVELKWKRRSDGDVRVTMSLSGIPDVDDHAISFRYHP